MAMVMLLGGLGLASCGGAAAAFLYRNRPQDPIFQVLSIHVKGFDLHFSGHSHAMATLDSKLSLSIKVINPNIAPIEYTSTTMDIFYAGDLLGQAKVEPGGQGPNSVEIIELPAKISGLEITKNIKQLIADIRKREMDMVSVVTIKGHARLWKWTHKFEVHVESNIKIDPVFLDVIEQDNKVNMELEPIV